MRGGGVIAKHQKPLDLKGYRREVHQKMIASRYMNSESAPCKEMVETVITPKMHVHTHVEKCAQNEYLFRYALEISGNTILPFYSHLTRGNPTGACFLYN